MIRFLLIYFFFVLFLFWFIVLPCLIRFSSFVPFNFGSVPPFFPFPFVSCWYHTTTSACCVSLFVFDSVFVLICGCGVWDRMVAASLFIFSVSLRSRFVVLDSFKLIVVFWFGSVPSFATETFKANPLVDMKSISNK